MDMRMRTGDHDIGIALPATAHGARARGDSGASSKSAVTPFEGAMTDDEGDDGAYPARLARVVDRDDGAVAVL